MKKSIGIVVLLAALTVLAVVVVRQNRQITRLKEQPVVTVSTEKKTAQPVQTPAKKISAPRTETGAVESVAAPIAPAEGKTNFLSGLAGMMKDPQMKEMIRAQQKMMFNKMYGSLFKYLNWPESEQQALKDLLLDRQMAMADVGMSMMSGSDSDRKQAVEKSQAIKSEYDKKIQDLLGSQDYPVFQQYEETQPERMQIQMFKDALSGGDALTDQQEDSLIAAMYAERKAAPASPLMNNQSPDPGQFTEEKIAETIKQMEQLQQAYAKQAAAILTPAQLEQFTKWQQQWNAMVIGGMKMAAQMFGNKGTAQPPPAN
jgi:hypothetical protein